MDENRKAISRASFICWCRYELRACSPQLIFSSIQFNSVQFSSDQFSSVQLLTILLLSHITIHFSSIQFSSIQISSIQFISIQFSSVQFSRFMPKRTGPDAICNLQVNGKSNYPLPSAGMLLWICTIFLYICL